MWAGAGTTFWRAPDCAAASATARRLCRVTRRCDCTVLRSEDCALSAGIFRETVEDFRGLLNSSVWELVWRDKVPASPELSGGTAALCLPAVQSLFRSVLFLQSSDSLNTGSICQALSTGFSSRNPLEWAAHFLKQTMP